MVATTLEQSRRLVSSGISPESADMHYAFTMISGDMFKDLVDSSAMLLIGNRNNKYPYEPAWSLDALIKLLPIEIDDMFSEYHLIIDMQYKMPRYVYCSECYHTKFPWDFENDNLIENIIESILWLKAQGFKLCG